MYTKSQATICPTNPCLSIYNSLQTILQSCSAKNCQEARDASFNLKVVGKKDPEVQKSDYSSTQISVVDPPEPYPSAEAETFSAKLRENFNKVISERKNTLETTHPEGPRRKREKPRNNDKIPEPEPFSKKNPLDSEFSIFKKNEVHITKSHLIDEVKADELDDFRKNWRELSTAILKHTKQEDTRDIKNHVITEPNEIHGFILNYENVDNFSKCLDEHPSLQDFFIKLLLQDGPKASCEGCGIISLGETPKKKF